MNMYMYSIITKSKRSLHLILHELKFLKHFYMVDGVFLTLKKSFLTESCSHMLSGVSS